MDYDEPRIRVRRSGDDVETDVTFESKGMVLMPADWASWSATRTLLVPIIYDQSGNGKHANMVGACTLDVATKSIVCPLGLHYYTMPQFTLPTGTIPYTIYFRHGRLESNNRNYFSQTYMRSAV